MSRKPRSSPVESHHAEHADPGSLMERLKSSQGVYAPPPGDPTGRRIPRFEEWNSMTYHEMHNKLVDAQREFAGLPARLRSRFDNDPYQLIRFIEDPDHRAEALTLGLVTPTDEEAMAMRRALRKGGMIEQTDLVAEIAAEQARAKRLRDAENPPNDPPVV